MRFVKLIEANEIRIEDTVMLRLDTSPVRISDINSAYHPLYVEIALYESDRKWLKIERSQKIILLPRSWPAGHDEAAMLSAISRPLSRLVGSFKPHDPEELRKAREAMEGYLLGMPSIPAEPVKLLREGFDG